MSERPIIFSGPMVRAILEGRKTQTRRVMKPQPKENGIAFDREMGDIACHDDSLAPSDYIWRGEPQYNWTAFCPYGQPGDVLWVRENHSLREYAGNRIEKLQEVWYWADGNPGFGNWTKPRPSIYMPRWACRLWLRVTGVRVERVQDISEEDARAEGVIPLQMDHGSFLPCFEGGWDRLNAKRGFGWDTNPFCWALEFERTDAPTTSEQ